MQTTGAAAKQLRAITPHQRKRLLRGIATLQDDPHPPGVRKLVGADNAWRLRVGDYRVIYEIHDDELLVLVVKAAHRRDVYRD
mgnify:FL=1